MRTMPLVLAACLLSGCVPTADFTELRDDVRELQSDNKKLKQTEAELRKRLEAADRNQLPATTLKRLDAVEAALTDLKTRQQGIDQKLGAVITQLEESARQPESLSGRSEEFAAHAQYWIGESYANKREYRSAVDAYERVVTNHPKSDKVPAALYKAGSGYAELGDLAKARSLFKRVIEEYSQSDEAARAKQRLAELR